MRLTLVCGLLLVATVADAGGKKGKSMYRKHDAPGSIMLNGVRRQVKWTDGDSFKITEGEHKGTGTRLVGYNTLEAYGPVHSWGEWDAHELYELALASSQVAASKEWDCTTDWKRDGYQRLLINCPALAVEMAKQGHGLAYAVDGATSAPEVLEAQADAMKNKRGMWAKGTTFGVITSLHSVGEDGDEAEVDAYNRVVDTRTGQALKRKHQQRYETCQKVCETTDGQQSCMVYVPFKQRYHGQPDCLR